MGCGGSKLEEDHQNQALVKLCRERRHLLKTAADNRFALATAHVAYFTQLAAVGETLWRFVEEELVLSSSSSLSSSPSTPVSSLSSLSSPVIVIPGDDFKKKPKGKGKGRGKGKGKGVDGDVNGSGSGSHLHLSTSSSISSGHSDREVRGAKHREETPQRQQEQQQPQPQPGMSYIPDSEAHPPPFYSFDPTSTSYGYPNQPYYDNSSNYGNGIAPGFNSYSSYPEYSGAGAGGGFNSYSSYPGNSFGAAGGGDYTSFNDNGPSSYGFGSGNTTYTSHYMKKSSTRIPTVYYEEPKNVNNHIYSFSDAQGYGGYENVVNASSSSSRQEGQKRQEKVQPPTPPSPKVSAWDYFNPFESGVYSGVQQTGGYGYDYGYGYGDGNGSGKGYESNSSSPDSREVREREGIPDLEEETETEASFPSSSTKKVPPRNGGKSVHFQDPVHDIPYNNKGKNSNTYNGNNLRNTSSRSGANFGGGSSRRVPFVEQEPELKAVDEEKEVEDSSLSPETEDSVVTVSSIGEEHNHEHELGEEQEEENLYVKKKGVSFEVEEGGGGGGQSHEVQSSMPSSLTTLSADGTRDLREVVREIKDEFEAATYYGKEVSTLLEVGREPYRPRSTFLKVMLAKVCSTSVSSSHSPSSVATEYPEELDSRSLASTLDKLYAWENKLYNEIKDEERLRLMYEKQCKKLKTLDEQGAENSKIESTQFAIRKLLTKINVSVRAVDFISSRIQKLRDEELQPQLKELIYGLRKMWKLMLKCHQKQFQAILESKTRALRANTGLRKDSSVRATIQLEAELLKWCRRFNNWIEMQRSYTEALNGWLERCIQYEPEVTSDGVMPFSPGRIGAPPVFIICHDWKQAMERVSESQVQTAMSDFATSLHQLWERQDEEQRRRLKAENMYKDFEKQIRAIRVERHQKGHEHDDTFSDKNTLSIVASDSGISPLDDLKVDLDSMRQRVKEQRAGHKEAIKLVHDAVSRSIQAGLIPIFESLESFTSEASKALDDVRLEHVTVN